jgi:hypothetical protein
MSEWVSEWLFLSPTQQCSAISWREQVKFQWDGDEMSFVLDQDAELDFYSASSLKQQSVDRHVAPLGHIIMIPSQLSLCSYSVMLRAYKLWFGMLCICILLIWYNCCNSGHVGWLVRYADIILKLHQICSKDISCQVFSN